MDVSEAIRTKRAVRQFSDQPVSEDAVRAILDAGRRAQSSRNLQARHFVVVQNRDRLQALSQTSGSAGHIAAAAFAVVLVGMEPDDVWNHFDLGQAASYMQIAALEYGIGSGIAALDPTKARAVLNIPAEMTCYAALAFGYPASDFAPAKRGGRKPLEEVVHWEQW
jgi:nitroreductase